jgi:molybdopterin converting factor small subunit
MEIEIRGFGAARELTGIKLEFQELKLSIANLRHSLLEYLKVRDNYQQLSLLIQSCAFADKTHVLDEQEIISHSQMLNILPPVCGG